MQMQIQTQMQTQTQTQMQMQIQTQMQTQNNETKQKREDYLHNTPKTPEQIWYRQIFEHAYPNLGNLVPYFWMPKYVEADDASARTLEIYKN
jgi:hypothetical protein